MLVDARDLDPAEATFLNQSNVRQVRVEDVSVRDLPRGPIVVHVDLDVIDGREVPGLRFPVANGPSAAQVFSSLEPLFASGRVVALSIACSWFDPVREAESIQRTELLGTLLAVAT